MSDVIDEIKSDKVRNIALLGDLNADFHTYNGKKLKKLCDNQNLTYLVNEPTRITQTSATVLDQILVNVPNFVTKTVVHPPVSSNDHCTVGLHLNFKIQKEPCYTRLIWKYKEADFNKFRKALDNSDFNVCFENDNVDEASDKWTEIFLNVAKAKRS